MVFSRKPDRLLVRRRDLNAHGATWAKFVKKGRIRVERFLILEKAVGGAIPLEETAELS
jgi:hypothetical protein